MDRFALFLVSIILLSCNPGSEKRRAAKLNEERFGHQTEKEALFVLGIIDASYKVIDLAKLGEEGLGSSVGREKVKAIIVSQTSAITKLKAFAEQRGIEVPREDSTSSRNEFRRLNSEHSQSFNHEWVKQMKELQYKMKRDIESFQRRSADAALM